MRSVAVASAAHGVAIKLNSGGVGLLLNPNVVQRFRTGIDHLAWMCRASGIDPAVVPAKLKAVGLEEAGHRRIDEYSLGMCQRLALAAALLLLSVPVTRSTTLPEMISQQHLEIMLMGVDVANITMIVLAVLFVAEENRTQMVEVTAALMPRRSTVVVAKTLLMTIVASVIAMGASS